jgi:phage replication O-like protein O
MTTETQGGVAEPNYTQIPNIILDNMHHMSDAELRVVLAIARKTKGWHKETDELSISQLMKLTGLSNTAAIRGGNIGAERGIIKKTPVDPTNTRKGFTYRIVVRESYKESFPLVNESHKPNKRKNNPSLVNESHKPYEAKSQVLVNDVHTQKKAVKESLKENGGGSSFGNNKPLPFPSKAAAASQEFLAIQERLSAISESLPDPFTGLDDLANTLLRNGKTAADVDSLWSAMQYKSNPAGAFIHAVKTNLTPKTKPAPKPQDDKPKDGDTKMVNGVMRIFKSGKWYDRNRVSGGDG